MILGLVVYGYWLGCCFDLVCCLRRWCLVMIVVDGFGGFCFWG